MSKKFDPITLVDELGLKVTANPKCTQLADIITKADSYDAELTNDM